MSFYGCMLGNIATIVREQAAAQKAQAFLWAPVFFGIGVGVYFSLLSEPASWVALIAVALSAVPAFLSRGKPGFTLWLLLVFACAGFAVAQGRTHLVYTPIIKKKLGPVEVTGVIETIEQLEEGKGRRLVLINPVVENLAPEVTPRRVRLTMKKGDQFKDGQRVKLLAQLNPPSPPVAPGAFDFQRHMYFLGIGAVGFIYKTLEVMPVEHGHENYIEDLRNLIAERMGKYLGPDVAPMAIAFTNGQRTAISEADNEAMRDSGLAHLISISGLHIGLFSAFVFFVARLIMACIPGFAIKYPIKKYAAILGFLAAAFYTLLAGASIPTQRSLIMVGMAYLAIMLDRSPISLRLVAFAALAVLLIAPESLVSASFQMSFGAVAALILFFDRTRNFWAEWNRRGGFFNKFVIYLAGTMMTTVIATLATSPFSLFHFQQLALYGLPANAIAVPLTSFIIMPAIVISLIAMPFQLEYLPLKVLEAGMGWLIDVAHMIAQWPHGVITVPAWPLAAFILSVCGLIFFALWQGWGRYAAVVPIAISCLLIVFHSSPDVLVSQNFDVAAYRDESGMMYVSGKRKNKFSIEAWERMSGLPEGASRVWPKEGQEGLMSCDSHACRLDQKGVRVSFLKQPAALTDECAWAQAVLSFVVLEKKKCDGVIVRDKLDAIYDGSHALWLDPLRMETVEQRRGHRPWTD